MNERPSMPRFVALLISGALASKLLGFGREILMANVLGASLIADGFRGAVTAVLLPLAFLQNESVPAVMIPMQRAARDSGEAPQKLAALLLALTAIAIVLMLVVETLGALWVDAVVSGFGTAGRSLTLQFVRIMAVGMPASVMLNVLSVGEIARGRSRLTNIRASVLNLAALLGIVLLMLTGNVDLLAWSFCLGFNGLAVWGLLSLWRTGVVSFAGCTAGAIADAAFEFFRRLRPLIALPLAEQANIWVERLLASRLSTGALASFDYARTLTDSALLLISQPVGLAVLSSHRPHDVGARVEAIVRPVLAVALPASLFLAMFSNDVVRLVFQRGAFGDEAVLLTSQALSGIAVGLWASTLAWILIRLLNGAGRNGLAAAILVLSYAANVAFNLLSSGMLSHRAGGTGTLLLGLGEAVRGGVLLVAIVMALRCGRRCLLLGSRALPAALLMGLLGWQIQSGMTGSIERLLAGAAACLASILLGVSLLMPLPGVSAVARVRDLLRTKGGPM